jgi:hypothetical protein
MSWTEPGCRCGGAGWDGCEPTHPTPRRSRLRSAIEADAARRASLVEVIHQEATERPLRAGTEWGRPLGDEARPTVRALPAARLSSWDALLSSQAIKEDPGA